MTSNTIDSLDEQINKLYNIKVELHKQDYNHTITRTKFNNQVDAIETQLKQLLKQKIALLQEQLKQREKELSDKQNKILVEAKEIAHQTYEANKAKQIKQLEEAKKTKKVKTITKPKVKVIKPKVLKPKVELQVKSQSQQQVVPYKTLIIKALKMDAVDNEEKLLYVVDKWQPGKDKEVLRRQVRNIICIIKKSNKYSFDDTKYKITLKDN